MEKDYTYDYAINSMIHILTKTHRKDRQNVSRGKNRLILRRKGKKLKWTLLTVPRGTIVLLTP